MVKVLVALVAAVHFLGAASTASADCNSNSCYGRIKRLYVNAGDGQKVYVDMGGSPGNCTLLSGVYIQLDIGSENGRVVYNTLLAAYTAGQSVTVRTNDGGACFVKYVAIPVL